MGCNFLVSNSSYDKPKYQCNYESVEPKPLPNPNPKNFKILDSLHCENFLIVKVNYPDCTNYEGNKIMVYENVTLPQLKRQGTIDPHFSNNNTMYNPIARFEPTTRGWAMAMIFVQNFLRYEKTVTK